MAATASIDYADRVNTVEDLYWRQQYTECIHGVRDLLGQSLLPCLYSIKCHVMLAKLSVDMIERNRHRDTAEQLLALHTSDWSKEFLQTTIVSEIQQELAILADGAPQATLSGLEDSVVHKRYRSLSSDRRASRKTKIEPESLDFMEETEHHVSSSTQEQRYGNHTVRQTIEHDFSLFEPLRPPTPVTVDQDVKFDPRHLDEEWGRENQARIDTSASHPTPLDSLSPFQHRSSTPPCKIDSTLPCEPSLPTQYSPALPSLPQTPREANLLSPTWSRTPPPLF